MGERRDEARELAAWFSGVFGDRFYLEIQNAGIDIQQMCAEATIDLAWQKGLAWMAIIIGLVVTAVLPPLLGSLVWLVLPQEVKSLITGIVNMGMMMLVMFIMMQFMKPLAAPAKEKPKKLEEAKA